MGKKKQKKSLTKKIQVGILIFALAFLAVLIVSLIVRTRLFRGHEYSILPQNNATQQLKTFRPKSADFKVKIPILMYHHLANNPKPDDPLTRSLYLAPDMFKHEMDYLNANHFQTIDLQEMYNYFNFGAKLPAKPIIVTIDDGYLDFYQNGFTVLKNNHQKAVLFVITDYPGRNSAYANFDQLREMQQSGMEIEAHSMSHPDLSKIPSAEANQQVVESKKVLEKEMRKPVLFFAYPSGKYNPETIDFLKKAGYLGAVTVKAGQDHSMNDFFELHRVRVAGDETMEQFVEGLQ